MTFPTPRAAFMGEPPNPEYEPRKADIVSVLEQMQAIAATQSLRDFHTDPDDLPPSGNTPGDKRIVLALDEDGGGVYSWTGAAWTRIGALPAIFTSDIYAEEARNWATGEGEPGGPGTRSARFWAEQAERWGFFLTIAEGLAQTEPGDVFGVIEPGILSFYQNIDGTELLMGSIEGTGNFTSSNDIINNSDVAGVFVTDALNTLNSAKADNQQPPDPTDTDDAGAYIWTPAQVNSAALSAVRQMPVSTIDFTAASQVDIPFPDNVYETELAIYITAASVSDAGIDLQVTRDNFTTVLNGASDYDWGLSAVYPAVAGATFRGAADSKARFVRQGGNGGMATTGTRLRAKMSIVGHANNSDQKFIHARTTHIGPTGTFSQTVADIYLTASDSTSAINGIRLLTSSGTITGRVDILIRR